MKARTVEHASRQRWRGEGWGGGGGIWGEACSLAEGRGSLVESVKVMRTRPFRRLPVGEARLAASTAPAQWREGQAIGALLRSTLGATGFWHLDSMRLAIYLGRDSNGASTLGGSVSP